MANMLKGNTIHDLAKLAKEAVTKAIPNARKLRTLASMDEAQVFKVVTKRTNAGINSTWQSFNSKIFENRIDNRMKNASPTNKLSSRPDAYMTRETIQTDDSIRNKSSRGVRKTSPLKAGK